MADPFRFVHRLRVRWGECDMQGIVFNPNYMAYVDVALTEYWRAIGMVYPQALAEFGLDSFMVAARQSYRAPARFDDDVDVAFRTEFLGTTSLRFAFAIRRGETALFEGAATYVIADRETMRPKNLPARLIQAITDYEAVAPELKPAV